jgi:hypothetical protein
VRLVGTERTVKVDANGAFPVTIDLSTWMPASLEGIVCDQDGTACTGCVILLGERSGRRWQCGEFALDQAGRFRAQGLLPGTYRLRWYRSTEDREAKVRADEIDLSPGKAAPLHQFRFGKD